MEDNFRNVLIILSGIVIGAIFIHGLWTIRKQKNPYKLKASKEKVEPLSRSFDGKGFDQDGVGQVVVKKQSLRQGAVEAHNIDELLSSQVVIDETFIEPVLSDASVTELNESLTNDSLINEKNSELSDDLDCSQNEDWFDSETPKNFSKDELGDDLTPTLNQDKHKEAAKVAASNPVYKQPVINAKPAINPTRQIIRKSATKAELKRNQIEINFGDVKVEDETTPSISVVDTMEQQSPLQQGSLAQSAASQVSKTTTISEPPMAEQTKIEPQVIILSVVMPANQQMLGAALLPSLLTLGLKYGDMNIFHRHQDSAGNGEVTFSLANMMKPGSFNLDSMETFATQGVSLFMTLPNAGDPFTVFEQMLSAAKQLTQEFNGQLLDDKRNVMTKQTEQHYVSQVREFDRRNRIALVE